MSINVTITDQGLASLINVQNNGSAALKLTEVKFGKGRYTPKSHQTDLEESFKSLSTVAGKVVEDHLIHLTIKDESADEYEVGEFGIYTDTGVLFALYSEPDQDNWLLEKDTLATLLLSIDITLQSAKTDCIEFGSIDFISPPATYTSKGVIQLADNQSVLTAKHDQVPTVNSLHHYVQSLLVGQVAYFPAINAPVGWLVANGDSVLRSDYPILWDFAQNSGNLAASDSKKTAGQFGPGNGKTSFTLPDLRGEFIRGLDKDRGLDKNRTLGTVQGDLVKAHTHAGTVQSAGQHDHSASSDTAGYHHHSGSALTNGEHKHSGGTHTSGYHGHSASCTQAGSHMHQVPAKFVYFKGGSIGWPVFGNPAHNTDVLRPSAYGGQHAHNISIGSSGGHTHSIYTNDSGNHSHNLIIKSNGGHSHDINITSSGTHGHNLDIHLSGGVETRPRNVALLACIKY